MADDPLIADMAESLLMTAAAALDDPPQRQVHYWWSQTIAAQCEQLVVAPMTFLRSSPTTGRGNQIPFEPRAQPSIPLVTFEVRLTLECWPTINASGAPASVDAIMAASERALAANWTLWKALCDQAGCDDDPADGCLFADVSGLPTGCLRAEVGPWTTTGPPTDGLVTGKHPVTVVVLPFPPSP